jgi:tetratricopeptide (TPR) repeat protein
MKPGAQFFRRTLVAAGLSVFAALTGGLVAQTASVVPAAPQTRAANLGELSQAELLKAYLNMQEQLHATQLSVLNNRVEAEAAARAQTAALTEKLEFLRSTLEAERERQRAEQRQAEERREFERREAEQANRTILWIAGIFGGVGLLATLLMPLLQWRTLKQLTTISEAQPQLPAIAHPHSLAPASLNPPSDQAVNDSNQRLLSAIDRMEQRILELEHTAPTPTPTSAPATAKNQVVTPQPTKTPTAPVSTSRPPFAGMHASSETQGARVSRAPASVSASPEQADAMVRLLGRGRLLIEAGRSKEAIACYDEILLSEPNNAEALVRKGVALEHLKRDEEALECYNLAIRADRRKTLAYLCKGAVCGRLNRHAESVESYEQALRTEEASVA